MLKMDYFASKSSKSPTAGTPPPDPILDSMTRECANDPTTIEQFWLMQMLGNFGAKCCTGITFIL